MYNRWCDTEAIIVFGDDLGSHIYKKWRNMRMDGAEVLQWYSELDNECRNKIVERANIIYN